MLHYVASKKHAKNVCGAFVVGEPRRPTVAPRDFNRMREGTDLIKKKPLLLTFHFLPSTKHFLPSTKCLIKSAIFLYI